MTRTSTASNKLRILVACMTILTCSAGSAKANDYDNSSDAANTTPFSSMTPDTYDGYPLFRHTLESGSFHYAAKGIDVQASYDSMSQQITYTVTENDSIVTRTVGTSHSGYRMIHGVNYSENLFVLSFRR